MMGSATRRTWCPISSSFVQRLLGATLGLTVAACGGSGTSPDGGTSFDGYQVAVTVTGLQGSGLVLTNNGSGDFEVPSGGDRAFFNDVKKGSSYNVAVKTQPTSPWQTCTVTNGTGTINGDVNVSVTCLTNQYAVRGSVSALTGAGLSLLMNNAGAQSITPGTTSFSFPGVPSMAQYAVTIGTQPFGQTCAIGNSSGLVLGADVNSVAVTCGIAGITIGGDVVSVVGNGLTVRLNEGPPMSIPPAVFSFTFPYGIPTGTTWSVTVASPPQGPVQTCTVIRGKGKAASTNVTSLQLQCYGPAALNPLEGSYVAVIDGKRQYLTFWSDGIYSLATRLDSPLCTNAGNGIEYGVYRRFSADSFFVRIGKQDTNGDCGLYDPALLPNAGPRGTIVKNGATLTLTMPGEDVITLQPVESVPGGLYGAFSRADGNDGDVILFESDGTYLYLEAQEGPGLNQVPGYERGCYTVGVGTVTTSLGASCRPNGLSAFDSNGPGGGFSAKNGKPFPVTMTSPTTAIIDGVSYRRLIPQG